MTRSSPEQAMTEAAEAARPSTKVTIRAWWARSMLVMARPSQTSPPTELIRTWISVTSSGRLSSASETSRADTPQNPPHESIGP